MDIPEKERERLRNELRNQNNAVLGGIAVAVLAVVLGVTALVLGHVLPG
jgi:hypothetical protein